MPTDYVATLARYVLVEAENEAQARKRGQSALSEQNAMTAIRTVRLATADEIELAEWHQHFVAE
jgi:hypothetical protein